MSVDDPALSPGQSLCLHSCFLGPFCHHAGLSSLRRGHLGLGLEGCIRAHFGKWAHKPETLRRVVAAAEVPWEGGTEPSSCRPAAQSCLLGKEPEAGAGQRGHGGHEVRH